MYCSKILKSKQNLAYHQKICKKKPSQELVTEFEKLKQETHQIARQLTRKVDDTNRNLEDKLGDEMYRIESETKSKHEELEQELQHKDELNRQLMERIKQLEEKTQQLHTPIINNNTINNNFNTNLTIYSTMNPDRVKEIFDKYYTIETLMGGQKALADFVVDKFVTGEDGMIYLCVDRSRKKVCYTTDGVNFIEDTHTETLLSHLIPAYPVIKSKVEWSEYEKKYNPHLNKIHDGYDEILAIRTDGTVFRSQLCRRLPATMEDKERMDQANKPLDTLGELRQQEEREFVERKEEIERIVAREKDPLPDPLVASRQERERTPNQICGVGLGRLDGLRMMYKTQGIYKIHKDLVEAVEADPAVSKAYEDYVKRGTFKGIVIWD